MALKIDGRYAPKRYKDLFDKAGWHLPDRHGYTVEGRPATGVYVDSPAPGGGINRHRRVTDDEFLAVLYTKDRSYQDLARVVSRKLRQEEES